MNPADITALRTQISEISRKLGNALEAIENVEGLLDADGLATLNALATPKAVAATAICHLMAHEYAQAACTGLEAAAARLADLITAADRVATSLAPKALEP
ncbi:MAG: hypothetical protein H7067_03775 [Burkholderiales bacterium]|nr:hypothetical protein [Opitutaceae bacterium]